MTLKGKSVKKMAQDIASMKPHCHPYYYTITPMIIWPSPDPNVPIPSIIPVIVAVASFACCRPRSAVHVIHIRWCAVPKQKPNTNISTRKRLRDRPVYPKVIVRLTIRDTKTAVRIIGDRFPSK